MDKQRAMDALMILDGCNPVAIANLLFRSSSELLQQEQDMDTVRLDPALRLIAYKLADLYGVSGLYPEFLDDYTYCNEVAKDNTNPFEMNVEELKKFWDEAKEIEF